MSVTFGTPVKSGTFAAQSSYTIALSGVTSGQPIVLVHFNVQNSTVLGATPISDNFSTPYTWTKVDATQSGGDLETWIGTGGAGTSGTITVTIASGPLNTAGWAVSAIGASVLSGLNAVDVHGASNAAGATTMNSVSLTPGASGEGAVYAVNNDANSSAPGISASPTSPWTSTSLTNTAATNTYASVSTDPSPTSGVALTTTWTQASAVGFERAGLILKILVTAPLAPTLGTITPGNAQLSAAFTPGSDGGSSITTYKYSTDNGATYLQRQTGTTASPIVITTLSSDGTTPLVNGTPYTVRIKAVNAVGDGTASNAVVATPSNAIMLQKAALTMRVGGL